MYECFNYLTRNVIWDADYDFSDYGYEGEGVVHACHCRMCKAEIIYIVPAHPEEEDNE